MLSVTQKLQSLVNTSLGHDIVAHWSDAISNEELGRRIGQLPVDDVIGRRKG